MKKLLVILAVLALLPVAPASADTFHVGSHYVSANIWYDGTNYDYDGNVGGGSFDSSVLNGVTLPWVYCVDLEHKISLGGDYNTTQVTSNAYVNGAFLANAGKVAWLLDNYADAGIGDLVAQQALQGAIWKAIYGDLFEFKISNGGHALYAGYIAALGDKTGSVSSYLWITPGTAGTTANTYQGLVSVPEPGSLFLLGAGLFGLAGMVRRRMRN